MTTSFIRKIPFLMLMFTLILSACASAQLSADKAEERSAAQPPAPMEAPAEGSIAPVTDQDINRLVIKNARLSIVVDDPSASMDSIAKMAEEMGGYVVSANVYQRELENGGKTTQASTTLRVPAERLNEAISFIKSQSNQDALNETIESQDVTSEYIDLESRLRSLEEAEAQYQKIMENATTTEDVLKVYNEMVRTQQEIEVIKGQMKYYEESAALSAISVELIANEAAQPLTIGTWEPTGVIKSAVQALIKTLKFLANALLWILIYVLPVLLVLYIIVVLPVTLVWRAIRRSRAKKTAPPTPQAPPEQPQS